MHSASCNFYSCDVLSYINMCSSRRRIRSGSGGGRDCDSGSGNDR